jgi:molybdenum cofactor cytidylyltransferase
VPALFARRYFPHLSGLADGGGAKRVIAGAGNAVHAVPFPGGAFDIDTPQDYERLHTVEGRPAELN